MKEDGRTIYETRFSRIAHILINLTDAFCRDIWYIRFQNDIFQRPLKRADDTLVSSLDSLPPLPSPPPGSSRCAEPIAKIDSTKTWAEFRRVRSNSWVNCVICQLRIIVRLDPASVSAPRMSAQPGFDSVAITRPPRQQQQQHGLYSTLGLCP